MAEHGARIEWRRNGAVFTDNRYSRRHRWVFGEGVAVPASASPHLVPLPLSAPDAVDPEEAFVASLSSCHMLWFLSIAAKRGYVVDRYDDDAVGVLDLDPSGHPAMVRATLHPEAIFSGVKQPVADEIIAMHREAHEQCFIARSVKTDVRCEPVLG
jgi:organic hydroperoxide reductase OsmC/OhrA